MLRIANFVRRNFQSPEERSEPKCYSVIHNGVSITACCPFSHIHTNSTALNKEIYWQKERTGFMHLKTFPDKD